MELIPHEQGISASAGDEMDYPHPVIEKYWKYSEQMEQSFRKNRFDAFRQLACARFKLLRLPKDHPFRSHLIDLFREDTGRWVDRLEKRILKKKDEQSNWDAVTGGLHQMPRSGRVVDQVG